MKLSQADFTIQLLRLTETYGDKHYPPERARAIYEEVKDVPVESVEKIVTDLIADRQYPPMRDAFRAAAAGFKGWKQNPDLQRLYSSSSCRWCGLSGFMFATKTNPKISPGRYAFRCPFCEAAEIKVLSTKIPQWSKKYVGEFWPQYSDGSAVLEEDAWQMPEEIKPSDPDQFIKPTEQTPEEQKQKIQEILEQVKKEIPKETQTEFDL